MEAPYTKAAFESHDCRSSMRTSSRHRTMQANTSRSSIWHPLPNGGMEGIVAVAFSQKVNCNPQTNTANNGGSQAVRIERRENGLSSRCRCSWVRSCGSKATDRASNARLKTAQTTEKTFKEMGISFSGRKRMGKVSSQ